MTAPLAAVASAVRPNTLENPVMAGAVAKMIVTVSTMFKPLVVQRLLISVGVAGALVASYFGSVMMLLLDPAVKDAEAWGISVLIAPCMLGILVGGSLLSYHGVRKWWDWVTDND